MLGTITTYVGTLYLQSIISLTIAILLCVLVSLNLIDSGYFILEILTDSGYFILEENMVICFEDHETGRCLKEVPTVNRKFSTKMYSATSCFYYSTFLFFFFKKSDCCSPLMLNGLVFYVCIGL